MAYPQGVNFRSSAAYVTDAANDSCEADIYSGSASYPRTTAQGNNVGWEDGGGAIQGRNRNTTIPRLAGVGWPEANGVYRYRFDLPSAGNYNVRIAMGEYLYARTVDSALYDTTTSLGTLCSGSTGAANSFKAANNTTYTAANWVTNEATHIQPFTFSTTICRFYQSASGVQTGYTAHLYVEEAAGGGVVGPLLKGHLVGGGILTKGRLVG